MDSIISQQQKEADRIFHLFNTKTQMAEPYNHIHHMDKAKQSSIIHVKEILKMDVVKQRIGLSQFYKDVLHILKKLDFWNQPQKSVEADPFLNDEQLIEAIKARWDRQDFDMNAAVKFVWNRSDKTKEQSIEFVNQKFTSTI